MKEEFEKRLMKLELLETSPAFNNILIEDTEILKAFKESRNLYVVMKSEDIAIIENQSKEVGIENFKFTFARKIGNSWKSFGAYFPTLELAFLGALEHKYDARSGACFFAGKVLNIIK